MLSYNDIELIQTYKDKTDDTLEKQILTNILEELQYRLPVERIRCGNNCPKCNAMIDNDSLYCKHCGQALD